MFKNYIVITMLLCFTFSMVQPLYAQEHDEDGFVIEAPVSVENDLIVEPPEPVGEVFMIEPQQEPTGDDFVIEEEIEAPVQFDDDEPAEEKTTPGQFITADLLTPGNAEPAIKYYIHSDINRKFTGLITNLKLEKIYGVIQQQKSAIVYFDYSYTSIRNRDHIIMDKGKMTFMKFNSGKWFNEELSIYLMDKYQPYRRRVTGGLIQLNK